MEEEILLLSAAQDRRYTDQLIAYLEEYVPYEGVSEFIALLLYSFLLRNKLTKNRIVFLSSVLASRGFLRLLRLPRKRELVSKKIKDILEEFLTALSTADWPFASLSSSPPTSVTQCGVKAALGAYCASRRHATPLIRLGGYALLAQVTLYGVLRVSDRIMRAAADWHERRRAGRTLDIAHALLPNTGSKKECRICGESMQFPASAPCGHVLCWNCIMRWTMQHASCPMCRQPCRIQQVVYLRNY